MAKEFDATLNQLIDVRPADWVALLCERVGIPFAPFEMLDTDLATTLQADKVFRINGERPSLIHLELESGSRLGIPAELLRYNVHVHGMYGMDVDTVILLLRPKANPSDMTGEYVRNGGDGRRSLWFRYTVLRLWEEPMNPLLEGGLGTLPLALLTNEAAADMGVAFQRFTTRLASESGERTKETLARAALGLMHLRMTADEIQRLYEGVTMKVEDTLFYQLLAADAEKIGMAKGRVEGRVEAEAETILRLGTKRFGAPPADIETAIQEIRDSERLDRIIDRILDAWKRGKRPMLHGWVYDIGSGLIERVVEQVDSAEKAMELLPRN